MRTIKYRIEIYHEIVWILVLFRQELKVGRNIKQTDLLSRTGNAVKLRYFDLLVLVSRSNRDCVLVSWSRMCGIFSCHKVTIPHVRDQAPPRELLN